MGFISDQVILPVQFELLKAFLQLLFARRWVHDLHNWLDVKVFLEYVIVFLEMLADATGFYLLLVMVLIVRNSAFQIRSVPHTLHIVFYTSDQVYHVLGCA